VQIIFLKRIHSTLSGFFIKKLFIGKMNESTYFYSLLEINPKLYCL